MPASEVFLQVQKVFLQVQNWGRRKSQCLYAILQDQRDASLVLILPLNPPFPSSNSFSFSFSDAIFIFASRAHRTLKVAWPHVFERTLVRTLTHFLIASNTFDNSDVDICDEHVFLKTEMNLIKAVLSL